MADKERIHYFDIAKGLVILITIFLHTGGMGINYVNHLFYLMNMAACTLVFPFFMPMFFLIRGYYYKKELPFMDEARIAATRLLLPMILLFFWTEQWFCSALFIAILIHHQLKRVKNIWLQCAIYLVMPFVGSIMAAKGYNWHYFGFALLATPFIFIGEKCRWLIDKKASTLACGIIYALCLIIYYIYGLDRSIDRVPFLSGVTFPSPRQIPYYFVTGVSGTVSVLALARLIGRNRYLEYVGKNSLIYFLFSFTAIHLCNLCFWNYLQKLQAPDTYYISFAIYLFINTVAIASCTALSVYINRHCPWVVGKGL